MSRWGLALLALIILLLALVGWFYLWLRAHAPALLPA